MQQPWRVDVAYTVKMGCCCEVMSNAALRLAGVIVRQLIHV